MIINSSRSIRNLQIRRLSNYGATTPLKFYKNTSVVKETSGFTVYLDKYPLKTTQKTKVTLRSEALANLVALEWGKQPKHLNSSLLPVTTLVSKMLDYTEEQFDVMKTELLGFLRTDSLFYLGDQKGAPAFLDSFFEAYGPVKNLVGLSAASPSKECIEAVTDYLNNASNPALIGVDALSRGMRSVALGLLAAENQICLKDAVKLSRVEEEQNISEWGLVEGGHDVDRAATNEQVYSAKVFLRLTKQ
eukprot:augustus_masked-scaffold_33-processed-gene-0.16-mRNA-1 protein AED:1.00 eAED:1.00 QI:0/-1/0/0/-1/1/1/0/246